MNTEPMTQTREQRAVPAVRPVHLTREQIRAAKDRVEARGQGFTYWTPNDAAPVYPTRREAEDASIQEWRDNL